MGIRRCVLGGRSKYATIFRRIILKRWASDSFIFWFTNFFPSFQFLFTIPYIKLSYTAADHSVANMFRYTNEICAHMNKSRYSLLRYQAMCRYRAVRDAGKIGEGFASKASGQLETTSDFPEFWTFHFVRKESNTPDGICRQSGKSCEKEKVQNCRLDLAECLLVLYSPSNGYELGKLTLSPLYRGIWPEDVCTACVECSSLP